MAEGGDVIIVNPSIGGWEDTSGGSSDDSGSGSTEAEELVPVSLSQYGIYYCYNTGAVTASDSCAGGIAAYAICSRVRSTAVIIQETLKVVPIPEEL